jgi:hypothetical protein
LKRTIAAGVFASALAIAAAAAAAEPQAGGGMAAGLRLLDFEAVAQGEETITRERLLAFGVERLSEFDLDGDGVLDREELAVALPARERHPLMVFAPDREEARADRIMRMPGADEDGAVEVEAVARRQVDMLFARLDRDGDGAISPPIGSKGTPPGPGRPRSR